MEQLHYAEVFVNPPDAHGDLEPDALVYYKYDPAGSTYILESDTGEILYSRTVFNDPAWIAQVKHDITEIMAERFDADPANVRLLLTDGSDW